VHLRRTSDGDDGMTLIEVVVAMAIIAVGLLGLLDELVAYVHQQASQHARATALRIATTTLEDARRLPSNSLTAGTVTAPAVTRDGVAYTTTTSVQLCAAGQQTCTQGSGPSVARVSVSVNWSDSHGAHTIALSTSDADTSNGTLAGSTTGLTNGTSGVSGTSVSVTSLSVSPASITVDSNGNPTSNITVTLQAVGLASSATVPLTWTDDNNAHQTTLVNTATNTWAVTIPKASITRAVTSSAKTVVFAATVPGVRTFPTTTLTVVPQPAFSGSCTVTASPIVLLPLTRKTSLPEIVSCTTVGLASTDAVKAVYASGSGTATLNLSSSNGSSWTGTLASGTSMASSGGTEGFTFTLTAADGTTKTQNLSVSLA
jgi:prepilin-type N-terminal cleavage/methylation domain-containing protein